MKKIKLFSTILVIMMIAGIFGPGYTKPSAAAVTPIEIKWTILEADAQLAISEMTRQFAKQVAEKTEGRVTVKVFWGGQLGAVTDYLKMVSSGGVAQGGNLIMTYHQWELPLWAAAGLPFLTSGYKVAPKAIYQLGKEWAPMQDNLKRNNVKVLGVIQIYETVIATKTPMTSIDQLKGQKMWILGFWQQAASVLGIVNVPLTPPEVLDSLQKNLISGIWGLAYQGSKTMGFYESAKYQYALPFGGNNVMLQVVNLDTWNKISAKDQQTIEAIGNDVAFNFYTKYMDNDLSAMKEFYKGKGVTDSTLSSADLSTIQNKAKDVIWNNWIKTAKEKGVPADEWMQRYQAKVKELSK